MRLLVPLLAMQQRLGPADFQFGWSGIEQPGALELTHCELRAGRATDRGAAVDA